MNIERQVLPACVTVVRSTKGDLNKTIGLLPDGTVTKSHPLPMSEGYATLHEEACNGENLAAIISDIMKDSALVLGELKDHGWYSLPVLSNRKSQLYDVPSVVRSQKYFHFNPDRAQWVLLDHDTKDMPAKVAAQITAAGGWQQAAVNLWPDLVQAETVDTASSSSHIIKPDGTPLQDAAYHKYVLYHCPGMTQKDLLDDLMKRGWLHGFSYWIIGAAGQLLERGLFDVAVGSPERLSFEAPPTLTGRLVRSAPEPIVTKGYRVGYTKMTLGERAKAMALRKEAKEVLRGEAARARNAWLQKRALELVGKSDINYEQAMATVMGLFLKQAELVGEYPVQLSDGAFVKVNQILAHPAKYHLVDGPSILEGPQYGWSRIQIKTLRENGEPLRQPHIVDYSHGTPNRYNLVTTSSSPGVKLARPLLCHTTDTPKRATEWAQQEILLAARNEYQFEQHVRLWRTRFSDFHGTRKNKPRARQQVGRMPRLKMPQGAAPPKLAGVTCACQALALENAFQANELYESKRREPFWWDASQTGVGKSYARNKFLTWVTTDENSGWNRSKYGPFVVVLERHDHINTALDELQHLNVVAVRGRDRLCQFPEQISRFGKLVRSVESDVCQQCPFRQMCEYYGQFKAANQADVVLMTREQAYGSPDRVVGKRVACWLFDEDQTSTLWDDPIEVTRSDLVAAPLGREMPIALAKVLEAICKQVNWYSSGSKIVLSLSNLDEALEALGTAPERLRVPAAARVDEFRARMNTKLEMHAASIEWAARIRALLKAKMDGHVVGAHVSTTRRNSLIPEPCITIHRCNDRAGFHRCYKAPRVLYSATADQYWNNHGLDFGEPDRDNIPLPSYVTVRFMDCHGGSKSSMFDPTNGDPSSLLQRLATHCTDQASGHPALWVSQKAVAGAALELLPENVLTMHFGATTSRNEASGVPYTLVVGRPLPPPAVFEAMVEALLGNPVQRLAAGTFWSRKDGYVRCGAGHSLGTEVLTHPDPLVDNYLQYHLGTAVAQAVGRPRAIRAKEPMRIDIFGKVPTGYHVDQIGSFEVFEASPEELVCRTGLVPMSGEAVNKLAPALFPMLFGNAEQVKRKRRHEAAVRRGLEDSFRLRKIAGAGEWLALNAPPIYARPNFGLVFNVQMQGQKRGVPVGFPEGYSKEQCQILADTLLNSPKLNRYKGEASG